jgi:hypothetical protein
MCEACLALPELLAGFQCCEPAELRENGRLLCWVHEQARLNPERLAPLSYFSEVRPCTEEKCAAHTAASASGP